ncbi:Neuralized-like protein 4 [Lamellibrachia satsuma]|nr:Neuralized-like protein 4 [Lamellibrachia satsuma]
MSILLGSLKIVIAQGDLTKEQTGVIVNSSNKALDLTTGATAKAIAKVGGNSVVQECKTLGEIRPGGIATTGAGDLPCSHIIHIDMHKNADWDSIIGAVLLEADSLKVESIAFPALGTGDRSLSPSDCARKMLDTLDGFTKHNVFTYLKMVRIVIYQASMFQIYLNYAKEKARASTSTTSDRRNRHAGGTFNGRRSRPTKAAETGNGAVAKPRHGCSYRNVCYRYFGTLGIPGDFENNKFTICYCSQCHCRRGDDDYSDRGQPPKTYGIPIGWCRIGLHTPVRAKALDYFRTWHRAFHGTTAEKVPVILKVGDLLVPGDRALGGTHIGERSNHYSDESKPEGFDTKQIFVSPTIRYAGNDTYATPTRYVDGETSTSYVSRVAFHVLISPDSYKVGAQTIGATDQIDPQFSNEELEWSTAERGSVIIYGVLVRLDEVQ